MKITTRIITILVAIMMLVSCFGTVAFANEITNPEQEIDIEEVSQVINGSTYIYVNGTSNKASVNIQGAPNCQFLVIVTAPDGTMSQAYVYGNNTDKRVYSSILNKSGTWVFYIAPYNGTITSATVYCWLG